jgi:hypothetical protein
MPKLKKVAFFQAEKKLPKEDVFAFILSRYLLSSMPEEETFES